MGRYRLTSIRAMMTFQALARTFALLGIWAGLTACYPELGGAKTGAELAPSLDVLREVAPDHHRRLADGTFDTLSIPEQLDFVAEVQAIGREHRRVEREKSRAARRRLAVEFLDSIETLTPESAEEVLQVNRIWLLEDLKFESDAVAMEDSFLWVERQLVEAGG